MSGVNIAFFRGDERSADFEIEVSSDNSNWTQVWSGRQPTQTLQLQTIEFAESAASHLRIVGFGNTTNNWNSFTEVEICVTGEGTVDPPTLPGALVGAYLAYGGSPYGEAIATDKVPLLNGDTAELANYSSFILGINRVVIDMSDLPQSGANLSVDDFAFQTGNDDDPDNWSDAPTPSNVSVEAGAGESGSDRVTITWPNYAITNTWLLVTVKSTENTGLEQSELFYFGHSANEGNSPVGIFLAVNFTDVIDAFFNQTGALVAEMSNVYDFNRDQTVNFLDAVAPYFNQHFQVKIITPVATIVGPSGPPPVLPGIEPSELIDWYLNTPADRGDGISARIDEDEMADGFIDPDFFWYDADGGAVFRCTIGGYKTSANTSYTRSELREMLRAGNTSISTRGVNANNWVFGSAPQSDRNNAGGVDGVLTGTLAVNHVSTTGSSGQVGRVIVGQIHATDDEPCRLYYRKLPGNTRGTIYFAHEPNGRNDIWYEMIGTRSSSQSDPADGIALDEVWSYEIRVEGNLLTVTIIREGKPDVVQVVDMSNSGYDQGGQFMYFRAGAYIQDNTGDPDDYAQVTFYALDNQHGN